MRWPDLLALSIESGGLEAREGALAHAIGSAVVRRWLTLSWLIEEAGGRAVDRLDPWVGSALLCGSAQLLLLDRVPPHAALNESVEWVKRTASPRASGLVNAVLRRVAELRDPMAERRPRWTGRRDEIALGDGTAVALTREAMPEDDRQRMAVATSTPRRLLEKWTQTRGWDDAELIALHGLIDPPTVLNTAFVAGAESIPLPRHERPGAHLVPMGMGVAEAMALAPGSWVQDAGSAGAISILGQMAREPELVVDLCAGRGTKTRQLLAMFPGARVVAAEVDADRLEDLRALAEHEPRLRVLTAQGAALELEGRADLVLADVPCSNTGVLARRPEARYRYGPAQLARLLRAQREIALAGSGMLAPGGRLVYSTCSIEPEENGEQARWMARELGLRLVREAAHDPRGLPIDPPEVYADGGYAALLTKGP